jgi:hypothetical protein
VSADNYGGWVDASATMFQYSSERDRRRAEEREQKDIERQQRVEREREENQQQLQQRQENRKTYVPPPPPESHIVVNYSTPNMTADRVVSAMAMEQAKAAAASVKVPPQRQGYTLLGVGDEFYYYKEGYFFMDVEGDRVQVPGPPGAMVSALPSGFEVRDLDSGRFFVYNDTWYQRVMMSGNPVFKVVPPQG